MDVRLFETPNFKLVILVRKQLTYENPLLLSFHDVDINTFMQHVFHNKNITSSTHYTQQPIVSKAHSIQVLNLGTLILHCNAPTPLEYSRLMGGVTFN